MHRWQTNVFDVGAVAQCRGINTEPIKFSERTVAPREINSQTQCDQIRCEVDIPKQKDPDDMEETTSGPC